MTRICAHGYLVQKHGTIHFRHTIPVDLREQFERTEIKLTLTGVSLKDVPDLCRRLAGICKMVFAALRNRQMSINIENIRWFLLDNLKRELSRWTQDFYVRPAHTDEDLSKLTQKYDKELKQLERDRLTGRVAGYNEASEEVLAGYGLSPPSFEKHKELTFEYVNAEIAKLKVILNRLNGNFEEGEEVLLNMRRRATPPVKTPVEGPRPSEKPRVKVGELINQYIKESKKLKDWSNRSVMKNKSILMQFDWMCNHPYVDEINKKLVNKYRDISMQMPKGYQKAYPGLTAAEIAEKYPGEGVGQATFTDRANLLTPFWNWLVERELVEGESPFKVLKGRRQPRKRSPFEQFTSEDLEKIFKGKYTGEITPKFKKNYQYWAYIIAYFCGTRLTETVQIAVDDFKKADDFYYLDLRESTKGASLKTQAAWRQIPLHPEILDLGFANYVEAQRKAGYERIFHDAPIKENGVSQVLRRYLQHDLNLEAQRPGNRKAFHSFRTTLFNLWKQQRFETSLYKQMLGHEDSDLSTGHYAAAYSIETIYNDLVLQIDFPVSVRHLKDTSFFKQWI